MNYFQKHITRKFIPFFAAGFLILLFSIYCTSALFAQSAGFAGSFTRVGFGPRGMSMGNAMAGVFKEGVYSYYNPAHAAVNMVGNQIDLSTSLMSFDRTLHKLNGTFPLPPNAGLSLSIINGSVDNIDGRTSSGYHTGELSTHEYQFSSAFGIRASPKFYAGIGLKYNLADYHTDIENATSIGFDLGFLYLVSQEITVGGTVRDILSNYSWNTSPLYGGGSSESATDRFPVQARLGVSWEATEVLLVSLEPGVLLHPSAETVTQLKIGARYRVHERITLRAGWEVLDTNHLKNSNHFSAGFSVHLPFDLLSPSVDYAFVPEPNRGSSIHVFGIRLNL